MAEHNYIANMSFLQTSVLQQDTVAELEIESIWKIENWESRVLRYYNQAGYGQVVIAVQHVTIGKGR